MRLLLLTLQPLLFALGTKDLLLFALDALLLTQSPLLSSQFSLATLLLQHLPLALLLLHLLTPHLLALLLKLHLLALLLKHPAVVLCRCNARGSQPHSNDQKKKVKSRYKRLDQIHGVTVSEGPDPSYTRRGAHRHR